MKIFYKKDYLEVAKLLDEENEKVAELEYAVERLRIQRNSAELEVKYQKEFISKVEEELSKATTKIKELAGAKGGLIKKNNNLIKKNEALKAEIEELKSSRYLVKKLPPQKSKTQKLMGLKRSGATGSAKAILKQKNELEEK